jgi:ribose transport system ATP-binding protein
MVRLEVSGLRKAFAATQALAGVDLTVGAGEVLALIGENGAGKSTLIRILTGAHRADAGSMRLDGQPYVPADPAAARAAGVAVVYQELALCRHLSVVENLALGAWPARAGVVDRAALRRQAQAALDQLGVALPLDRPCGSLSVAQQQLTEICRALIATGGTPRVLILDEPTSSLTAADVECLFTVVRRLRAAGTAVIYISHALEECRALADRYSVLRDGVSVANGAMAEADEALLIRHMVGRELAELYPREPRPPAGAPVLVLDRLAGHALPVSASLELRRGEVVGIYGLIGAGRSETLRTLFGLDPCSGGHVLVAGAEATRATPRRRLDRGIALLSENRKEEGLCLGRSLSDNLVLSRPAPVCWRGRAWLPFSPRRALATGAAWIRELGIRCSDGAQAVGELSGGNQQKVALARLLHHLAHTPGGAGVLLLDEPTRGIDVGAKSAIYRLIGRQAAAGTAVVVVSSYLPELLGICDRIAVMRRGVLGPAHPVAAVDAPTLLAEALEPAR